MSTPDPLPPWIATNLGFTLARAGTAAHDAFRAALAGLGIRPRHYSLLSVLAHQERPSSQHLVAGCLQLDPSSVVEVVDELEDRGLLRRERDPADRRRNLLIMTELGVDVLHRARAVAAELDDSWFGALAPDERRVLTDLLGRIGGRAPSSVP